MKSKWLKVAEALVELSESIKALAAEEEQKVEVPKTEEVKKEEPKEKAESAKQTTLEDVRKALAEKSGAGFTAEVRALLQKHGGSKLSQVAESEYAAIMEEVKEIG